jgi:hypothetical protein
MANHLVHQTRPPCHSKGWRIGRLRRKVRSMTGSKGKKVIAKRNPDGAAAD